MCLRRALLLIAMTALTVACDDAAKTGQPADVSGTADTVAPDVTPEPELVLPPVLGLTAAPDLNPDSKIVEINLRAAPTALTLLEDGPALAMYTYDGLLPGPLIEVTVGDELIVHFQNDLNEPTTIHWHGLRIPDTMDGSPMIQTPVPAGGSFEYHFMVPEAGTFWYHPHVRTNEQVEKGLYGMLIVHEKAEERPAVDRERAFVLDDILLTSTGLPAFLSNHMEAMHGRSGNVLLTNGSTDPLAATVRQGETERWRLVNVANARTMELSIKGASWRVHGTDGGVLAVPYETERLTIAVGQRFDLEVIFDQAGEAVVESHVLTLDDNNNVVEVALEVATITITPSDVRTPFATWKASEIPARLIPDLEVTLELNARNGNNGIEWTINGMANSHMYLWNTPVGSVARITMKNLAGPEHPFHLHGQFFEIIKRNGEDWNEEPGLKDTVLLPGLETVEILTHLDNPGRWMAHCHILEHAELGMMAEFFVSE